MPTRPSGRGGGRNPPRSEGTGDESKPRRRNRNRNRRGRSSRGRGSRGRGGKGKRGKPRAKPDWQQRPEEVNQQEEEGRSPGSLNPNASVFTPKSFSGTTEVKTKDEENEEACTAEPEEEEEPYPGHDPDRPGSAMMQEMTWRFQRNRYQCAICYRNLGRRARVWNCSVCYRTFHLSCSTRWQTKSMETKNLGEGIFPCPTCSFLHVDWQPDYRCFCGKDLDPSPSSYFTPHSCGKPCGKKKNPECTHPCQLPCHPGKCEECTQLGPERRCSCGKTTYRLKCGASEEKPRECGAICGKPLNCGKHFCDKPCGEHSHDCLVTNEQTCFCGKKTEMRPCGTGIVVPPPDEELGEIEDTPPPDAKATGGPVLKFKCGEPCGATLACGNHACTKLCGHEGPHSTCVRKKEFPQPCACGRETFKRFKFRKSCVDPLPTCKNDCGRMLACGKHLCQETCHDSPCKPCPELIKVKCRCGTKTKKLLCHELEQEDTFTCTRKCPRVLSCGIHQCKEICHELRTAQGYQGHYCPLFCNKPLTCTRHSCSNHCHGKRDCPPCEVYYRNGLACVCGETKIERGVMCVEVPPNLGCTLPCSRERSCPHPCKLRCHEDECPPCVKLVTKHCKKHGTPMHNIPCHVNVCCGKPCGDLMRCGLHFCKKKCHNGPCHNEKMAKYSSQPEKSCGEICGRALKACGHTCQEACHGLSDCPQKCNQKATLTCFCGHLKQPIPCGELGKKKPLQCREACKKAERNKRLQEAFGF